MLSIGLSVTDPVGMDYDWALRFNNPIDPAHATLNTATFTIGGAPVAILVQNIDTMDDRVLHVITDHPAGPPVTARVVYNGAGAELRDTYGQNCASFDRSFGIVP